MWRVALGVRNNEPPLFKMANPEKEPPPLSKPFSFLLFCFALAKEKRAALGFLYLTLLLPLPFIPKPTFYSPLSFFSPLLWGLHAFDSRMAHSHVKKVKGRRKARTKRKVSPTKASKPSASWACFVRANCCLPAMIRGCYRIERILGKWGVA